MSATPSPTTPTPSPVDLIQAVPPKVLVLGVVALVIALMLRAAGERVQRAAAHRRKRQEQYEDIRARDAAQARWDAEQARRQARQARRQARQARRRRPGDDRGSIELRALTALLVPLLLGHVVSVQVDAARYAATVIGAPTATAALGPVGSLYKHEAAGRAIPAASTTTTG